MKVEAWIFGISAIFFGLVSPAYWVITHDWTGTSALTMVTFLALMIAAYLGFHASRMDPRLEDRKDAEIAEGAGEYGFYPPYSWWPLWCAIPLSVGMVGIAYSEWWLVIIAFGVGMATAVGWVFEYYRGEFAH